MDSIPGQTPQLQALWDLQYYQQWVNYIFLTRDNSITKPPINPSKAIHLPLRERLADATNSTTWGTYEQAIMQYQTGRYTAGYKGVGFVFSGSDPFTGIDLDHARDQKTGRIAEWAKHIIRLLNSYTELSPSGEGFHILIRADLTSTANAIGLTELRHKKDNIEVYSTERYFTFTAKHLSGTPRRIESRQSELDELYFQTFCIEGEGEEKHEGGEATKQQTPSFPLSTQHLPLPQDAELYALASAATGGRGQRFQRLWAGDASDYRTQNGDVDESRADQALLGTLAYWTQKDSVRMERLFKQSGLYNGRPNRQHKWDARARTGETYGEGSIRLAINNCRSVYNPNWRPAGWLPYDEYVARKKTQPQVVQSYNTGKQTFPQKQYLADQQSQDAVKGGQRV